MQLCDPIDQLMGIANHWNDACSEFFDRDDIKSYANLEYRDWATRCCERRPSDVQKEMTVMRRYEEGRIRDTNGAFVVRLLYGWAEADWKRYFHEDDLISQALPVIAGPDVHPRTVSRLIIALQRFGVVDRSPGVRGRRTEVRLSVRGTELYEDFCQKARGYRNNLAPSRWESRYE